MKQILALMTLFLILMLAMTTVMAIGNGKQSQQMAQRMQLISSLRADLRSAKQEQETLNAQLESERAASRSLRIERNALTKRYDRLMVLLRCQPVGYTDMLPTSNGWTSQRIQPLPGESWLQAQALQLLVNGWQHEQDQKGAIAKAATAVAEATASAATSIAETAHGAIARASAEAATETPSASLAAENLKPVADVTDATTNANPATETAATTPPAFSAEAVSATAGQSLQEAMDAIRTTDEGSIFSVKAASQASEAMPKATTATQTATPESRFSPAVIATTRPAASPTIAIANPIQTPAPMTTTPATATPKPMPAAQPTKGPIATVTISVPPVTATPTSPPSPPQPASSPSHTALISGLNTLRQWLHQLDGAIDQVIDRLQAISQP